MDKHQDDSDYDLSVDDKSDYNLSDDEKDKKDHLANFGHDMKKFTNKVIDDTSKIPSNFRKWLDS